MSTLIEINKTHAGRQTHLGEAPGQHQDHSSADARRHRQTMQQNLRTEREFKGKAKDTHQLIVEVAKRLYRQIGFRKTTVADIAGELHMSPANVYRYFAAKSEINQAVCLELLGNISAEAEIIAASHATAAQRIRSVIASVEKIHSKRYMSERNLHELIEAAITENWAIMRRHTERMAGILERIIANGVAAGEFYPGDTALAARLVNTACTRYCHPRLMAEYEQEPEPALDQMVDFCFAALAQPPA